MILVVGAGLAGLTCAKALVEAGLQVRVIEASDHVGGRARTDHSPDGFLFDRGFQILLTAYPTARRNLDYRALGLKKVAPRPVLIRDGKWHEARSPLLTGGDRFRAWRMRGYARRRKEHDIFFGKLRGKGGVDRSIYEELKRRHFSEPGFIDSYARPFYGGLFLDRSLETSARALLFTLKMLASGDMAIPEQGMGAITEQLAAALPSNAIWLETRVEGIVRADGRAVGVTLTGGEEMQGDAVIVATDAPSAQRLLERELPSEAASVTCLYFAATESLYKGPRLLLNASADAFVNHAIQISNVAPSYAPKGQHLLSATILGIPDLSDADLIARTREDMASWFPGKDIAKPRHLATYRIRFAHLRQPPGAFNQSLEPATDVEGLFVAGEHTYQSSIHGAMLSGEQAASAVIKWQATVTD